MTVVIASLLLLEMGIDFKSGVSLKPMNTFGMDVHAARFAAFASEAELIQHLEELHNTTEPILILGGGSNMLFTHDFPGTVLKNEIEGISIVDEIGDDVLVRAGAGVVWHSLVDWCIQHNLGGIENLSLIPGTCGAAPIQNIGAYGVELKDVFYSLECYQLSDGKKMEFVADQCAFGYRDSVFKRAMKGKVAITSITLQLSRKHRLNVSYGAITQELQKMGVSTPTIRNVSDAVCNIRRSKLPDPAIIGNAGSFFKNPEVSSTIHDALKQEFPNMVSYPFGANTYKLAAGWLIEQCGWKGKVVGHTGSHKDQALVLVNYGGATGAEVLQLSDAIRASVREKFGVEIEPEVNII